MVEREFPYDVFISYSDEDEQWVSSTLLPRLESQNLKVCINYRDFEAGLSKLENIENSSKASRHTLIVMTSKWLKSELSMLAGLLSRTDDATGVRRRTIPVLLERCDLPEYISVLSPVDFTDRKRENEAWQNLFKSISDIDKTEGTRSFEQKQLARAVSKYSENIIAQVELTRKMQDVESPYKALLEYDIRDSSLFFGRDEAIRSLLRAVNSSRLTILHAKSGAGKTSLLKAGLRLRLFETGDLPIYVRPQQYPVDLSIKRAVLPQLENTLAWRDASLRDFLYEMINNIPQGKRLVIILDQFEEIFSQPLENRKKFSEQLAFCLDDDLLQAVYWVISLRGEYLTDVATFDPPVKNPINTNVLLQALNRENARLAIQEPARKQNVSYEDQLVDLILDELGPEKIHPPELQIVCSALYEAREGKALITHKIYDSLGSVRGILQEHFNRVMSQKIPRDRVGLAHQILSLLVSSDGSRLSRSKEDFVSKLKSQETDITFLEDVLERLTDAHLLRIEEVHTSQQSVITYELAHDYLVDKIELDQVTQDRKLAQELIDYKTRNYERNNKLVLSSEELQFISPYLEQLDISTKKQELIRVSRKVSKTRTSLSAAFSVVMNAIGLILALAGASLILKGISAVSSSLAVFWGAVILFAIIGYVRGWAKELLVSFSVILALALNHVIRRYIPLAQVLSETDVSLFWIRTITLVVLVWFGYQTAVSLPNFGSTGAKERLQDALFGAIMGALNGYLVIGTLLYYNHIAGYPFSNIMSKPTDPLIVSSINQMMLYMPPQLLGEPGIYFAIILSLVFVTVVYTDDKTIASIKDTLKRLISKNDTSNPSA